ncbi:MAG: DNA gyrase subunit A [Alphaproteobacteria bacterium]
MSASVNTSEVVQITVEEEMKRSYLDYAMSVIVSRALPDVRDGLKPVHRRILYAMMDLGFEYNKPFRKSARVLGEVLGKYHPHGEMAIYDAMVRMAQVFSMRTLLVDGQGNFGSVDGDKPASSRYTEVRLTRISHYILEDYDKETVDFQPNYDDTVMMPSVLPARFPNLLVNGAGGIAVGMATNIPTHNLGEVIDGCCALIDNPELGIEELLEYIPGPDFPTGGIILGKKGIRDAYFTGRGSVPIRGKCHTEELKKDRAALIITELPYQVNKARLVERIAELFANKELDGISELRDESDRNGMRVVIELKKDVVPEVILNRLYAMTPLQTSFGVNMLALNGGRPLQMNLKDVLQAFIEFREEVITRRTRFFLNKVRDRAHLILGLVVAVSHIDEIVRLIRKSSDVQQARQTLMTRVWPVEEISDYLKLLGEGEAQLRPEGYAFTEAQVKAILDLRLHRLTGLEREKLTDELKELAAKIQEYVSILSSKTLLFELMKKELLEVRTMFADPRRTALEAEHSVLDEEALIQREDMVVIFTVKGYVKRVPLAAYRAQRRGGKGKTGMSTREEDISSEVFVATTHTPLLFFTSVGKAYQLKVYELPIGTPQGRGKPLLNILPLTQQETLSTLLPLPEDPEDWKGLDILFVTSAGNVRRNALSDFTNIRGNGKIAMKLEEAGERLIAVQVCREDQDVLLTTRHGRSIRFCVSDVRQFSGRTSTGVRGVRLASGDQVVAMTILEGTGFSPEERELYLRQAARLRRSEGGDEASEEDADDASLLAYGGALSQEKFDEMALQEQFILAVSERGYGKRTSAYAYRRTGRGGQGVATMEVSNRNGLIVAALPVHEEDQIILLTDGGQMIRCPVHDIRIAGRRTQGVVIFRLAPEEKVVSVVRVSEMEAEEGEEVDADAG